MATMVKQGLDENRRKHGLVDGGIIHFECDSCGRDLLDVQITRPDYDLKANYKCECPYCKNFSKSKFIKGGFALIGHADEDQDGKEVIRTMPVGNFYTEKDGTVVLKVLKM